MGVVTIVVVVVVDIVVVNMIGLAASLLGFLGNMVSINKKGGRSDPSYQAWR